MIDLYPDNLEIIFSSSTLNGLVVMEFNQDIYIDIES
jgi:hypothetical protein